MPWCGLYDDAWCQHEKCTAQDRKFTEIQDARATELDETR